MGSPRVIAITGGKGGVGKTSLSVNLAIALARSGKKVCLFDADTGLANVNIMLGLHPAYTLEHLFTGEKSIHDIVLEGPEGIHIIPGASGFAQCVELDLGQQQRLVRAIKSLESDYDYLLIDTAAGISPTVLHFVAAAQVAAIVVTPEPTSLTDSFSLLKVLRRRGYRRKVQVIVNMAPTNAQAEKVFRRFSAAVRKYLDLTTEYMGCIWMDESMRTAVTLQRPVALFPKSDPSARSFYRLAERIDHVFGRGGIPSLPFSAYWQKLVERSIVRRQNVATTPLPEDSAVERPQQEREDTLVKSPGEQSGATQAVNETVEQSTPKETFSEPGAYVPYVPQRMLEPEHVATTPAESGREDKETVQAEMDSRTDQASPEIASQSAGIPAVTDRSGLQAPLSADAEEAWIDLRIRLNDFVSRQETTPEQVTTLLSSCIFSYGERLGGTAVDLIHGLLQIVEPGTLSREQREVLSHEFARLQGIDSRLAQAGQDSANDTHEAAESSAGSVDGSEAREMSPVEEARRRSRYDQDEFGSQQALVEKIRASSGRVPLESLLESIKYASLVDSGTD